MRFGGHRQPARLDVLARVVEPGGGIIDIVEHRIARDHAGEQRMAVARVRLVVGIVAGQPDEEALVGRFELDRAAPRPDILVVIVDAEVEVRSEEHTSELQSLMRISYAVFCLKKKKTNTTSTKHVRRIY